MLKCSISTLNGRVKLTPESSDNQSSPPPIVSTLANAPPVPNGVFPEVIVVVSLSSYSFTNQISDFEVVVALSVAQVDSTVSPFPAHTS